MNKDMIVDTVNSILKDNFEYVPLYTSMRVADELIKQGVIKTIETTSKKEKIEVFSSITKEEAEKFRQNLEEGDTHAISLLLYTQKMTPNALSTVSFLKSLIKLNDIIFLMEEGEIEWDVDFFELYRNNIDFISKKCLEIINEKEID